MLRWHRRGFKYYWAWKSRHRGGRPAVVLEVRELIRRISQANPRWGAPRIHGELLKLGIDLSQTTVAKYMVPTVTFNVMLVFVFLAHDRRRVVHFNVTGSPGARWIAQQIVEAFPWDGAPRYLRRDHDGIYGHEFTGRVDHMGIKEVKTAPRSPWQDPYVERLIGTLRRDCTDPVIVFNEIHLRRYFEITWSTITVAEHTCRWRRTPRKRGRWSRRTKGTSSSSRWSAGFTTATPDLQPDNQRHFKLAWPQ